MAQLKSGSTAGGNVILTAAAGSVDNAHISGMAASKLTGALPAIDGSALTGNVRSGRKNLIINGGFDVWQRGTSLTAVASYLADRWLNGQSETQTRQTFTVGQTDVPGNPTYYHRGAGGALNWYEMTQKMEDVRLTAGREVTLSYWAKGDSTFTNQIYVTQDFGTSGSTSVGAAQSTANITTSWARYTHTFTLASITGKTVGANSFLRVYVARANVANIVIDIANVQLELGSVATDFEHRSYGEELALCQRYYEVILGGHLVVIPDGSNTGVTSGTALFKVSKRVSPTCSSFTLAHANGGSSYSGRTVGAASTYGVRGANYGGAGQLSTDWTYSNDTAITCDAEL